MCIATETMNNGNSLPKEPITKTKIVASSSAMQRMTPLIIKGYIFNSVCFFLVHAVLPADLSPAPKYCPDDEPNCTRHGLFAFQIVSFFNLSVLGLIGFYTFFVSKRASNALPQTPQGRCLGNVLVNGRVLLHEADYVNAVIVIFQGWDFIASIFFEEHCTKIMMTHHVLAFLCGYFSLVYEVSKVLRNISWGWNVDCRIIRSYVHVCHVYLQRSISYDSPETAANNKMVLNSDRALPFHSLVHHRLSLTMQVSLKIFERNVS